MKLQIEITAPNAITKSGISKRGKPYQIIEQSGMITYPNGERRRSSLQLEDGDNDLPLGIYEPKDDAVYPGGFGKVEISMRARNWQRVEQGKAK
ncbi:MAG: single-stranded DNA-binding protein [Thermomonas sp.]|uniref:single-stranded DNA-binding protein n=1 Tax=Thermomonas sp. TaxID=1971895 RepID=UPI0039E3FDE6